MSIDLTRYALTRCAGLSLAACVTLTACTARDAGTPADSTASMQSTMPADTTAAPAAAAPAAAPAALSDANIVALHDEVNAADSTLAAAALAKLTSAGARQFARLMMGEHHALRVQVQRVAKAQNITPELPASDPFKPAVADEQSALASMAKGAAYDSTYIAHEVGIHQAVIDWAGKNPPQNAAFQELVKTAGPVLQKHLDMAQALQKKQAGS